MTLTFTMSEGNAANSEDAFVIGEAAFKDGPFRGEPLFPARLAHLTSKEDLKAWRIERIRKAQGEADTKAFLAVAHNDETNTDSPAGYASWIKPNHNWEKEDSRGVQTADTAPAAVLGEAAPIVEPSTPPSDEQSLPACMDVEWYRSTMKEMTKMRKDIWGDETNFWYLAGLAVHPDFQRKGLASKLLSWGIEIADRDGLPIYLEATPEGKPFYLTQGFKTVVELKLTEDGQTVTGMTRMPVAQA